MLTFGKTCLGTSGSYCIVDYLSMTKRENRHCPTNNLCATYGTVYYHVKATVVYTIGRNFIFFNRYTYGMTKRINSLLCNEYFVTYGAVLTCGKTCLGTSGSYRIVDYLGMTKRIYFIICVCVITYGASISSIACLGTCGSSHYCFVIVTERINFSLRYKNFVTY